MSGPFYDDAAVTIWHADARHLPIPDQSVDLIVTSPPYFSLRSYTDGGKHYPGQLGSEATPSEFVDALLEVTCECVRVLKPSGSLWVNLGDKYAERSGPARAGGTDDDPTVSRPADRPPRGRRDVPVKSLMGLPWRYALRCIDDLGLILRAEVVWSKPNAMPESVTDRTRRTHETWFHFTRRARYFSAIDEIREAHAPETAARARAGFKVNARRDNGATAGNMRAADVADGYDVNPLGKLPGSVWTIPTQPLKAPAHLGVDHYAAFPMEWPRRIIRAWCPEGGTVLDPFGGTGTTALVARSLGRRAIHVDLSADYCRLAQWRVTDPGELARALQVDKPQPVSDDQADLLTLLDGGAA